MQVVKVSERVAVKFLNAGDLSVARGPHPARFRKSGSGFL